MDSDTLEVISRSSGCFMPKMKCLSASGLVTGRASLFVEVKKAFFNTKLVTRYPAPNSLKAVALPAVRRLISPTHLSKTNCGHRFFYWRGWGKGTHLREVWVRMCRWVLQTLNMLKTKRSVLSAVSWPSLSIHQFSLSSRNGPPVLGEDINIIEAL